MTKAARIVAVAALAMVAASRSRAERRDRAVAVGGIQTSALTPTVSGVDGGANVCCSLVTGEVKNTSSVTIHIQLTFPGKSKGASVGTAVVMERDVPSNTVRAFTATGLQAACKDLHAEPNRRRQAGPRARPSGSTEVGEPASGLPALSYPPWMAAVPSTGRSHETAGPAITAGLTWGSMRLPANHPRLNPSWMQMARQKCASTPSSRSAFG